MYTFRMSWSFRVLVFNVAMVWALAPQLACFMPDQMFTEPEKECCKQMANSCGGANMSHECCRSAVRIDVGTATKAVRHVAPQFEVTERTIDIAASLLLAGSRRLSVQNNHAPPHDPEASSLILRI